MSVRGTPALPIPPPPTSPIDPLIVDLVEWVARSPQPYAEVMEAWRTSCPRLMVWEEASDLGLVAREQTANGIIVRVTPAGLALLGARARGPIVPPACPPVAWPRAAVGPGRTP